MEIKRKRNPDINPATVGVVVAPAAVMAVIRKKVKWTGRYLIGLVAYVQHQRSRKLFTSTPWALCFKPAKTKQIGQLDGNQR